MIGKKAAINSLSTDCKQCLIRPTVTPNKRHRQTDLATLPHDQRHFLIITRHVHRIGSNRSDWSQLSPKIGVPGRITLFADDCAPQFREFFLKKLQQIDAVILFHVSESKYLLGFQLFPREPGEYPTLKFI